MTAILFNKLVSMFLILFSAVLAVRLGVIRSEESKPLSGIFIYLILPCMWISAFQIEFTQENLNRFLLAMVNAVVIHGVFILLAGALKKPMKLLPVEQDVLIYTNGGNLIFPLIAAVLGDDWVIYGMAFVLVQNMLLWTHGKAVMAGPKSFRIRDLFSVNIISGFVGAALFFAGIRLPPLLGSAVKSVADMLGPMTMIYTGLLLGGVSFSTLVSFRRIWIPILFRLVLFPLVIVLIFRLAPDLPRVPDAGNVFVVSLMAAAGPCATSVPMFAQIYGKDYQYASVINLTTTLLCILTLPAMVFLYRL